MACLCSRLLLDDENLDDESVNLLLERISSWRTKRSNNVTVKPSKKRSRDRSLRILSEPSKDEDVDAIKAFLDGVREGRIDFWNPSVSANTTDEEQRRTLKEPLFSAVNISLQLEKAELHHSILRRFARVVVFKLCKKGDSAAVAKAFHEARLHVDRQPRELAQDVDRMVAAGSRYCHLAQKLGGLGSLAFLPRCGGPSFWEIYIGKSGTTFESVLEKLQNDELPAKSGPYHEPAEDVVAVGKGDISTDDLVQKYANHRVHGATDDPEHRSKRLRVASEETAEAFHSSHIQGHAITSEPPSQMDGSSMLAQGTRLLSTIRSTTFFTLPSAAEEQSSSTRPDSAGAETSTSPFRDSAAFVPNSTTNRIQGNGHEHGIPGSRFGHMSSLQNVQPDRGPSLLGPLNCGGTLGNFSGFGDLPGNSSDFGYLLGP
ncbi:hypothetical protein BU23DRAFT_570131 [Bimuria novae-zelandiae CBS 107.79]|uniref:Uncharacterized protein n=1 Tax=Bimuria novae-zelandiae CBS 107.79 TaxID=1447943 RepID=A0A6A5V397_9PLEO|nr:hypothetical protein BU23DRAFT_570131 [Bimuria novae-zelandiae CBS 107.79]